MDILFRYFWVPLILVTLLNGMLMKVKGEKVFEAGSKEFIKFRSFLIGFVVVLNIPWVVMGVGIMGGWLSTVWDVFGEIRSNRFTIGWWVSNFIMTGIIANWVLFKGGSEFLAAYSRNVGQGCKKAWFYKLFVVAGVIMNLCIFVWLYIAGPIVPATFNEIMRGGGP